MLEALMNPGSMTRDQWMILGILVFIVIGILYFVYRTYVVIRDSATKKYTPNIGLSRLEEERGSGATIVNRTVNKEKEATLEEDKKDRSGP